MRFFHCVLAEWALVAPRVARTRLGIWLLALGVALVWFCARGLDLLTAVLLAGSLGAILGAAGVAGGDNERRALTIALSHPTTPLAIATGRWIGVVAPAAVLVVTVTAAVGGAWTPGFALAGIFAAAAVGGCALGLVIPLGHPAALALFLLMALAGSVAPERLVALAHPGVVQIAAASALELGPALWHYRDIATGDWGAVAHSLAWSGLGMLLASAFVARRRALSS